MRELVEKLKTKLREEGPLWVAAAGVSKATIGMVELRTEQALEKQREKISRKVAKTYNYTVMNGLFKGLKLDPSPYWGAGALAGKCLGFYEIEVQDHLAAMQAQDRKSLLVDIGGADGFFAVGALVSNLFDTCIVFEISEHGRQKLQQAAELNGVQDRLTILGAASSETLREIAKEHGDDFRVLCDIEGAEYKLFDEPTLLALRQNTIIIEIHNLTRPMAAMKQDMRQRAQKLFAIEEFIEGSRDFTDLPEMHHLTGNQRGLIAWDGRLEIGRWWLLKPKANGQSA